MGQQKTNSKMVDIYQYYYLINHYIKCKLSKLQLKGREQVG